MIDFRYHLVSLVSVFLALAVGIVLGAGPLKGSIGDQLTQRVESLRQEKDALHDELDTANSAVSHRDEFVRKVAPQLILGQLSGRSIVVVSLPGVDSKDVTPLVDSIDSAGGTVTGQVSVAAAWADPQAAGTRQKGLDAVTKALSPSAEASGPPEAQLDSYLAQALVGTGSGEIERGTATGKAVIDGLKSADLIGVKGDLTKLAGSAVVVAPAVVTSDTQPTPTTATAQPFVALVQALDTTGGGTVISGPPSSATADGLIALIRKDDDAVKRISTVDSGSTSIGVVTAVLALHEQVSGRVGQYGFGAGASAPLPATTASGT